MRMYWDQKHWEKEYVSFISTYPFPHSLSDLDYFSIDLFETHQPVFKAYFTHDNLVLPQNSVVRLLQERNMIGYCETVSDSIDVAQERVDITLSNRRLSNVTALLQALSQTIRPFQEIESEVRCLNRIVTLEDTADSSLYHLGFGWRDEIITSVKCYFNAAKCNKNHVLETKIVPLCGLSEIAERLLSLGPGRPWMIGIDGGRCRKYKLYVRQPDVLWKRAVSILPHALAVQANGLAQWLDFHDEFFYTGIAICLNERDEFSVNLYFMTE